jgi:nicotinamidase/pyrazinamidase
MLEGLFVFLDIDTQRDFLEPCGALYVPGSSEILPNLERLTRFALGHQIRILATACAHSPQDPELRRFPPHCLVGTEGQRRIAATACDASRVVTLDERFTSDPPGHLTLWKRELDFFSRPDANELIARYNRDRPTFVVYGVATDYCVKAAVEGLLARSCRVAIVADAVRAIDPVVEADLLSDFARRGAVLTLTEVVCGPSASPTGVTSLGAIG